ncbi:MAG: hypothetical protein KA148_08495, partial [Ottowia sp.]|nr:hypothetical protein [Ottowia sp.]
ALDCQEQAGRPEPQLIAKGAAPGSATVMHKATSVAFFACAGRGYTAAYRTLGAILNTIKYIAVCALLTGAGGHFDA